MGANFEENMKKLEEIVNKLESGDTKLDESIKLFEEGVSLTKSLQKTLDEAEGKIKEVTENSLKEFELNWWKDCYNVRIYRAI